MQAIAQSTSRHVADCSRVAKRPRPFPRAARPRMVTWMSEPADPAREAARAAGLRYATDTRPGITRRRAGRGFAYRDVDGRSITRPGRP